MYPPRNSCARTLDVRIALFVATVFLLIAPALLRAAERTWDGSGRGSDWTDRANWTGLIVPLPGDSLRFPFGAGHLNNTNDYAVGTDFNLITFAASGYTLRGNAIGLSNGLAVIHSSGNSICYLPITLLANQSFSVSSASATLFLNGDINMSTRTLTFDGAGQVIVSGNIVNNNLFFGQLRKQGSGLLWLFQPADYDAATVVNGGTLRVDGRITNSFVIVNSGGTLRGAGRIGPLRANSGGAVQPGFSSPDILDTFGNVELNAGSIFSVRLNGPTAGSTYDQLRVRGTVTLGGTLNITAGYVPTVGEVFTIIDNDGSEDITGTFAGLPEGAEFNLNGRPFRISYGGRFTGLGVIGRENDVTIEAVPAEVVWDGEGGLNNRWSLSSNWVGDVAPFPGDDLHFPASDTSTNDFPAGRRFGSIRFGTGTHTVRGNSARVEGNIFLSASATANVDMPLVLASGITLVGPGQLSLAAVTLEGDETFQSTHAEATLTLTSPINIGAYDLTIRNEGPVRIFEGITGFGRLIKEGMGVVTFSGVNDCVGGTIVNQGTFFLDAVGEYFARCTTPVTVNTNGLLGAFGGELGIVEVRGGTFYGSAGFAGDARFLNGATFRGTGSFLGDVELMGCRLEVDEQLRLPFDQERTIMSLAFERVLTGTFDGLPEGSRFQVGPNTFEITYMSGSPGSGLNDVALIANPAAVWDGGGAGARWTTPANWKGDVAPLSGDRLVFPSGVTKQTVTNDFASGFVDSLTFEGASYLVRGNRIRLGVGVANTFASGQTLIAADLSRSLGELAFTVSGASILIHEGSITNTSAVAKYGPGTLRLAGSLPNSQGSMHVLDGELELRKTGVIATGDSLRIGDGTNSAEVTLLGNEQIADDAHVEIQDGARLELAGFDETIERMTGEGTISLGAILPGTLTFTFGTFSGNIVGNGSVILDGKSENFASIALTGTNSFSGSMFVKTGIFLRLDGIQTNSILRLEGGSLTGRGRLGPIQSGLGGRVQPGVSGAVFENALRSASIVFNPNTTFMPRLTSIDSGFENSKLQVAGTVDLGGSVLGAQAAFSPPTNATFRIIDNDGGDPIVGTFAGLPEGSVFGATGWPFRISYVGGTGNDVVLTRVAAPASTFNGVEWLGSNHVRFQGSGINGVTYTIQRTYSLNPPIEWFANGTATTTNGVWGFAEFLSETQTFYRAISP